MFQHHPEIAQQLAQGRNARLMDEAARERSLRGEAITDRRPAASRLVLVMAAAAPLVLLAVWVLVVR